MLSAMTLQADGLVNPCKLQIKLEHNVARFTRADRRGLIRLTEDRGAGKQEGQMCRAEDEERNCRNRQEASLRYPSRVHFAIAAGAITATPMRRCVGIGLESSLPTGQHPEITQCQPTTAAVQQFSFNWLDDFKEAEADYPAPRVRRRALETI
ncbi:hypothetical protein B0H14DRAFT_3128838 [Mycena olivaceomarginata]|nr:hypothetical protein B0H14DRAFT_3128838 [Mycena olivaceomarginata]